MYRYQPQSSPAFIWMTEALPSNNIIDTKAETENDILDRLSQTSIFNTILDIIKTLPERIQKRSSKALDC